MREHTIGIDITFAAENLVAMDAEAVEKILRLGRSFFDEGRQRSALWPGQD